MSEMKEDQLEIMEEIKANSGQKAEETSKQLKGLEIPREMKTKRPIKI